MTTDYSTIHQPITEPLNPPLELDEDQRQFFDDNGYLSGIKLLEPAQCNQLLESLQTLMEPDSVNNELWHEIHLNESGDPDAILFHALGAWRIDPHFHDLLWNPSFVSVAEQLLQSPVRFWHDQLFCKPAKHGGNVSWHQDYSYWTRTTPMQHLTCWIALEDANLENGCIQYIPGSHHWDLLPITGLAGDMAAIRETLSETQWKRLQNPVAIELKQGYASFHHPLLVHGSARNVSDRSRKAAVINAFADGVTAHSDKPLLKGIPAFAAGEKIEGQYFPILKCIDPKSSQY